MVYQFIAAPIKTIGNKWATFQAINFGVTAQPYYVLMSPDFSILNREEDYKNTTKDSYFNWLKKGKTQFENEQ